MQQCSDNLKSRKRKRDSDADLLKEGRADRDETSRLHDQEEADTQRKHEKELADLCDQQTEIAQKIHENRVTYRGVQADMHKRHAQREAEQADVVEIRLKATRVRDAIEKEELQPPGLAELARMSNTGAHASV